MDTHSCGCRDKALQQFATQQPQLQQIANDSSPPTSTTRKKEEQDDITSSKDKCHVSRSRRCWSISRSKTCKLIFMLILTLLFFVVEIISGLLTRSVALIADSAHMLSDSGALLIALFSVRISKKKSAKNTFGWVRAEVLGALVNAVFLLALCVSIIVQALKRFIHFEEIEDNYWLIVVGVVGLAINVIGLLVLHGHGHHHHHHHDPDHSKSVTKCCDDEECEKLNDGTQRSTAVDHECSPQKDDDENLAVALGGLYNSGQDVFLKTDTHSKRSLSGRKKDCSEKRSTGSQMNMRGVFLHVFNDALGSVVVIVSGLCIRYIPDKFWWKHYFDPVMSIMMVALIVGFTTPLLKESALILLQTVPTHIRVSDLQRKLLDKMPSILGIHEFHVWQLSGEKIIASAHIRCKSLDDYMNVANQVKQFFHDEGIHSTTIQPEFLDDVNQECGSSQGGACMLECMISCEGNTCCGTKDSRKPPSEYSVMTTQR